MLNNRVVNRERLDVLLQANVYSTETKKDILYGEQQFCGKCALVSSVGCFLNLAVNSAVLGPLQYQRYRGSRGRADHLPALIAVTFISDPIKKT